ncbi:MAG: CarD family transcriptional regulator [Firmicutes bacterium]|nr:CarD family transcriptional regulator [Bacillota bacterium]
MFSIGDTVMYGADGVCRIVDITTLDLTGSDESYYVLTPESENGSKIFVPTENSALTERIQPLLSKDEIMELVANVKPCEPFWSENSGEHRQRYSEAVKGGDRGVLIAMIRELYAKRSGLSGKRKRFSVTDEKYYKLAQKILYDEFSRVIPMKFDDLVPFVCKTAAET